MSSETTVYSILSGAAAVTAITALRIYPDAMPQEAAVPAIVYRRTGTEVIQTVHGTIAATKVGLEVLCLAPTRAGAEDLADKALNALLAGGPFEYLDRGATFEPSASEFAATLQVNHLS